MSNNYYANGAIHHDNHKEVTINGNIQANDLDIIMAKLLGEQVSEELKEGIVQKDKKPAHDIEQCHFVHPALDDNEANNIHHQIKRLVSVQGVQDICNYLAKLSNENKVLLPQSPQTAYNELCRMGMPSGEGFAYKTFQKYYRK